MLKTFLKFSLIVIVSQLITYYIAGIIAQLGLGANAFYPPSPNAISYMKDPHDPALQLLILPAQALRGLLFAFVLFPFRQRILDMGKYGGWAISLVIFVMGFVAASGGMIEHFVYFKAADYPVKFAEITFVEILIQTLIMGPMIVGLDRRFTKKVAPRPV
jgi:hypothetical protein